MLLSGSCSAEASQPREKTTHTELRCEVSALRDAVGMDIVPQGTVHSEKTQSNSSKNNICGLWAAMVLLYLSQTLSFLLLQRSPFAATELKVRNGFQAAHFPFFLLYMKIKGTGKRSQLHGTGCYTNRWDLFIPARTAAPGHIWSPKPPPWLCSPAGILSWSHYQDLTTPLQ